MGWTDEKVKELGRLWEKGLTANEIAKALGVTKNAVVGKVHRLCLKARPSPIKSKGEENEEEQVTVKNSDTREIETEVLVVESENKAETPKETDSTGNKQNKLKLVELDSHTCRWPIGDPRDEDFGFCGKKVRAGQTYCDEHSALAYVKATKK